MSDKIFNTWLPIDQLAVGDYYMVIESGSSESILLWAHRAEDPSKKMGIWSLLSVDSNGGMKDYCVQASDWAGPIDVVPTKFMRIGEPKEERRDDPSARWTIVHRQRPDDSWSGVTEHGKVLKKWYWIQNGMIEGRIPFIVTWEQRQHQLLPDEGKWELLPGEYGYVREDS